MKGWKRLAYYLLINVLVSACTVWVALTIWERAHPEALGFLNLNPLEPARTPTLSQATLSPRAPEVSPTSFPTLTDLQNTGTVETRLTPVPAPGAMLAITQVLGAGDLTTERVRVSRLGEGVLSLTGWQLRDEDNHTFTFPQLTMFANGSVDIYTKSGRNTVNALYWGLEQAVWSTGEAVTLVDGQGVVQASFVVP